ncbi:hypothetical protein NQZ68_020856 [Dissostichus eleginoides]|nr:hypothetical protein NQZ68_020856 [Dissostichus eleginoides]
MLRKCFTSAPLLIVEQTELAVGLWFSVARPLAIGADPQSLGRASCSASPPRLKPTGDARISATTPPALDAGPQSSNGVEMDPAARPVAVSARPQRPVGRASCSASPHRPSQPATRKSPLLGRQPSARTCSSPVASVWTRSPPTVWVEVLLLGRQPSARDRRDPLVVLAVQLASLFGNRPAACGARRPGRQLSGRLKRRRDPDTGG